MIFCKRIEVTVKSPYLTRANTGGSFGIDAPIARLEDGTPYLSGELLEGKILSSLRHLGAIDGGLYNDILPAFGVQSKNADTNLAYGAPKESHGREARKRIRISDLRLIESASGAPSRTRVAIDPVLETAIPGHLQVIEQVKKPGEFCTFRGEMRIFGQNAKKIFDASLKALQWTTQLGGLRSVGFGIIHKIESFDLAAQVRQSNLDVNKLPNEFEIVLDLQDLLCVGEKRTSRNTYASSDIIPGAVIKGALANQVLASLGKNGFLKDQLGQLGDFDAFATAFDEVHVSHAKPSHRSEIHEWQAVPHSLVQVNDEVFDAARLVQPERPFLISGKAPQFYHDWKAKEYRSYVQKKCLGVEVRSSFRLRTAIDENRRAAKEDALFGMTYKRTDEHFWRAKIALPQKDRNDIFKGFQKALEKGLLGIGRGGAFATVQLRPKSQSQVDFKDAPERLVLTLQTDALLRKPNPGMHENAVNAYRTSFVNLPSYELRAIFIREELRGGEFVARRFAKHKLQYKPWLLTLPGSVFVLQKKSNAVVSAAELAALNDVLRFGIAPPDDTLDFYGVKNHPTFQELCSFVTANGYGEVRETSQLFDAPNESEVIYV